MAMAAIPCVYLNSFMYLIPIDIHYKDSTHILSLVRVPTDNFHSVVNRSISQSYVPQYHSHRC